MGALFAVAVGVLFAFWLQSVLDASVVLLMAILVAAWFSGFWPALLASALATLALDYFFTPPLYTLTLEIAHIPHLLVFTLIAGVFVSISAARRRAIAHASARDELELKVQERTADLTAAHAAAVAAQQRFRDLVNSIEGSPGRRTRRRFSSSSSARRRSGFSGIP
jgi:K+-sensing histidine kinase KdpD